MGAYSVTHFSAGLFVLVLIVGLMVGGAITTYITTPQIKNLKAEISRLRAQVSVLWGLKNIPCQNLTVVQNLTTLSDIYEKVKDSVVLIRVQTWSGTVQGSGFIYNFTDDNTSQMVVITNYHVIHGAISISVTFFDGEAYEAKVLGKDPYADLAVLEVIGAPVEKFKPLIVVSSSTLKVGDPVIAIGNPYGLMGSMTTGIVSALNRTITEEEYAGGFAIANIIQISAPINPGNSGGPLLNYCGNVVGITTAIVADSQGLGFAIPSDTLRREIYALVKYGNYTWHSYMGIKGRDMDYETAKNMTLPVTYGWLILEIIEDGPSKNKLYPNDVIVALNGTRIRNGDDLASYLEANTIPGDWLEVTIWRKTGNSWQQMKVHIQLGVRPPPPVQ
ncbi:MAG: trypsin-like peptidase domain-containing protein [Candidatus Bathyarchaeia archaeon]